MTGVFLISAMFDYYSGISRLTMFYEVEVILKIT